MPPKPSPRVSRFGFDKGGLTLAHFTHRAQIYSMYRQLLRSTRALHSLDARLDSIAFYRPDFHISFDPPPSAAELSAHVGHVRRAVARVPWAALSRGVVFQDYEKLRGRRRLNGDEGTKHSG